MDINQARTFLTVADTGSFIETARKMNLTQSTVSARIKSLELLLGRELFERSKLGASLTAAGEQFRKHALAIVRVWQHARLEIAVAEQHRDHLSAGAPHGLWDGFLLRWVTWMRQEIPDIAITASSGQPQVLTQRLAEGTLDLAVMYRPVPPPGFTSEHLFDEPFVMATSVRPGESKARRSGQESLSINWGPELLSDFAEAYPEQAAPGLQLDLGSVGLDYLIANSCTSYVPLRLAGPHIARGRLRLVRRARRFVYPVYMVFPEARDEEAYEPILQGLRSEARRVERWLAAQ